MKKCPYCAEEIQDDAIKCRYCFSDLRADPDTAMHQQPEQTVPATGMPTASEASARSDTVSSPMATGGALSPSSPSSVQYTHSGYRYVLGYSADLFGIWDRQGPGSPVEQFPRTDEGWRSAWIRFVSLEPNHVPVGSEQGSSAAGGAAPQPGMKPPGVSPAPDLSDNQVLQYTHSGSTYLLGYGRTFFGIWLRSDPSRPLERFSRDDDGWASAWRRFTTIESNYAEVGLGSSGSS